MQETRESKKMFVATYKGVEFSVKITPHSQQKKILGWEGDHLKIRLHAAPEKNKANEELVELLSCVFDLPKSNILILKGHTTRLKRILLAGQNLETAETRLRKFLENQ
jgi:hypothetical protein